MLRLLNQLMRSDKLGEALYLEKEMIPNFFVPLHGLEPRQAEPESEVLPLHHKGISITEGQARPNGANI
jgi:hypothetical protein